VLRRRDLRKLRRHLGNIVDDIVIGGAIAIDQILVGHNAISAEISDVISQ
jgi:hypothetical protein